MADVNLQPLSKLGIDWESIVSDLKNRVQANLPNTYNDYLDSNFGREIIDAFAYEAAMMFYYNNATLNECFMNTARTRTSVYNHAKTLGYRPSPATSSLVTLRFYLQKTYDYDIYIPAYTVCRSIVNTSENINFYTTENGIIYAGDTYVDIEAKAGNLHTDTFICNGTANYRYKLLNENVNEILSVTVDNLSYEYVEFMDINNSEGMYYTVKYDSDYHGYISFGDGTYGVNPGSGKIIRVLYVNGADSSSNVESNAITELVSTIYDINNTIVNSRLNVYNPDYATGGSDCESLDEIKRNSTTIYKTQKRAVTLEDYESLLLLQQGVSKVKAIDHTLIDNIGIFGVKICVVPESNLYLSVANKKELTEFLEEKKIVATQFEFIDPIFVPFDVSINVKVLPTVNQNSVVNTIKSAINNYLSWQNRELGQSVSKNEIYSLLSNISGINSIDDITMNEYRMITLTKNPEIGSNVVNIKDTMNILTVGTKISIMNTSGETTLTAKISSINDDSYTLIDDYNEDVYITKDMGLSSNSEVFPVLYTNIDLKYGEKKVYIKNDDNTDSLLSKRNMILNSLNYSTIYFGDDIETTYQILFRVGDEIYLDKPLEDNISANTPITIMYKKMIPVLSDTCFVNTNQLKLTEYPRFGTGSYLIKSELPSFKTITLTMQRSSSGIDYIGDYMDLDYFVSVVKVYQDATTTFEQNVDYYLINENTAIEWTTTGAEKIGINKTFFCDVVRKDIDLTESKYYVSNIDGKTVTVSPRLKETLYEGQTFTYTTDVYNLMYWEIADIGNLSVKVNN